MMDNEDFVVNVVPMKISTEDEPFTLQAQPWTPPLSAMSKAGLRADILHWTV